jgi:hypothetical protein
MNDNLEQRVLQAEPFAAQAAAHRDRRERIATAAMAGVLADPTNNTCPASLYATWAIELADALIAELDKPKGVQP